MKKEDLEKYGIKKSIIDMDAFRKKAREFESMLFLFVHSHKEENENFDSLYDDLNKLGVDKPKP